MIVGHAEAGAVFALALILPLALGGRERGKFVGGDQWRTLAAGGIEVVERFLLVVGSVQNVAELASVGTPLHGGGRVGTGSGGAVDSLHGVLLFGLGRRGFDGLGAERKLARSNAEYDAEHTPEHDKPSAGFQKVLRRSRVLLWRR